MGTRKHRKYRQDDDLYALIGGLASSLDTNRTTVVEVAVRDLQGRLAGRKAELARKAKEIDEERTYSRARRGVGRTGPAGDVQGERWG